MKWKVENDRQTIVQNFERREGWTNSNSDNDWNIYWASTSTVQTLFHPEKGRRLKNNQVVNHFPNYYELTRKDFMVKNIKRYLRDQQKRMKGKDFIVGLQNSKKNNISNSNIDYADSIKQIDNFLPTSYILPHEYNIFVEKFRRSPPNTTWIVKPCNGARGKGIFIMNKLEQIKKWNINGTAASSSKDPKYVVSRYINNPLLINGKKFDLRIYVLITSFVPLKIFLGDGFARMANSDYSNDASERMNRFVHLTNVSIQKKSQDYNNTHGGKWNISLLRLYLEATRGGEATKNLLEAIDEIIIHSAKAVQKMMNNDRHCFECYGYDLLIDNDLKPWLIEINSSPSMSATTSADLRMKKNLIRDVVNIVVAEKFSNESHYMVNKTSKQIINTNNSNMNKDYLTNITSGDNDHSNTFKDCLGDFVLLYHETMVQKKNKMAGNGKLR